MIQVIRYKASSEKHDDIHQSNLSDPNSLDEYKLNIIDLNSSDIWKYTGDNTRTINDIRDIKNLSLMINDKKKSTVIIVLPQNLKMFYNKRYSNDTRMKQYSQHRELKNMLPELKIIIKENLLDIFDVSLLFETTKTRIADKNIEASFHIKNPTYTMMNPNEGKLLTKSIDSDKWTTISVMDDIIITTLCIDTNDKIIDFLNHLSLIETETVIPSWINEIKILNDREEEAKVAKNQQKQEEIELKIAASNKILSDNNKYKTILYETGLNLEKIVIDMLEEMLGKDLSNFEDLKKEDFAINLGDSTLIGEIKGVKGGSKNAHIGQLVNHMAIYKDENENAENLKGILIINHNLEITPDKRVAIPPNQIHLAGINDVLIIESTTFLEIFNQYRSGKISKDKIKTILLNETGLLKL